MCSVRTGCSFKNVPWQKLRQRKPFCAGCARNSQYSKLLWTQTFLKSLIALPGLADTGTVHVTTLQVPQASSVEFQVPAQVPLTLADGTLEGTVFISPAGGSMVGGNIVFTPAGRSGEHLLRGH